MLKIEIKSGEVETRKPINRQTGEVMTFREQEGWAYLGDAYPVKVQISLGPDQAPYAAGTYVVGRESFRVGKYNRLEVGRLSLEPMKAAAAA